MKLAEWKKIQGLTNQELGQMLGAETETARSWVAGEVIPRPEKMRLIHEITDGAVTANDFYDLPVAASSADASPRPEAAG